MTCQTKAPTRTFAFSRFVTGTLLASTLVGMITTLPPDARAQEKRVWQFNQAPDEDDAQKRPQATISFHVPETDNWQAGGICSSFRDPGFSELQFATDYGNKPDKAPVKLTISGGGNEFEKSAVVNKPQSEEEPPTVSVRLAHNDPLWQVLLTSRSISYGITGFSFRKLDLASGKAAINRFITTCRGYNGETAEPVKPTETTASSGGSAQKEAFEYARELNSPEAYEAFLKVYPDGFFAELARTYLARLKQETNSAPPQPKESAENDRQPEPQQPRQEQRVNLGPGSSPWYNFNYAQDEGNASSYAAGVTANGLELFAWCEAGKRLNVQFREKDRGIYPDFDGRLARALEQSSQGRMTFSGGGQFQVPLTVYGLTGEAAVNRRVSPTEALTNALLRDNTVTIEAGAFGATFQLRNSKRSICNVLNRCGAKVAACAPKPKPVVRDRVPIIERETRPQLIRCRRGFRLVGNRCLRIRRACQRGFVFINGRCQRLFADPSRGKEGWTRADCRSVLRSCNSRGGIACSDYDRYCR